MDSAKLHRSGSPSHPNESTKTCTDYKMVKYSKSWIIWRMLMNSEVAKWTNMKLYNSVIKKEGRNLSKKIGVDYHCFPDPKGPPANTLKRGIILATYWKRNRNKLLINKTSLKSTINKHILVIIFIPKAPPSFPSTIPMRISATLTSLLASSAVASHFLQT